MQVRLSKQSKPHAGICKFDCLLGKAFLSVYDLPIELGKQENRGEEDPLPPLLRLREKARIPPSGERARGAGMNSHGGLKADQRRPLADQLRPLADSPQVKGLLLHKKPRARARGFFTQAGKLIRKTHEGGALQGNTKQLRAFAWLPYP
jgi:hypothetical protein